MKREYSLKGRKLIREAYSKGTKYSKNGIQLFVLKHEDASVRAKNLNRKNVKIAITINKKFGKANKRNRAKRRIRAIISELLLEMKNGFIIIINPGTSNTLRDFQHEKRVIKALLDKAGLLHD